MRSRTLLLILTATMALSLSACETEDPQAPTSDGDANGDASEGAAAEVEIVDNDFEPDAVDIAVGETVSWTHAGDLDHTVTFDDGPDSGQLSSGDTFEHTFDEAGEFAYECSIHPSMTGTVTVTE